MEELYKDDIIAIAREAGDAIMAIYDDPEKNQIVDAKADDSPLTLADKASHEVIVRRLEKLTPHIPVLSEEGSDIPYEERSSWTSFWLVDPLDGTKEFIKRNGEFTVNIALIKNNRPIMGVIYVPATQVTYFGASGKGAEKIVNGAIEEITVNNRRDKKIAVRSKSHASPEEEEVLNRFGIRDFISVGSSLKFCMVAEGRADIYFRFGPTMEWDTGAGQAIAEAAGAKMYRGNTEDAIFTYNKKDLKNGSFLVIG